METKNNDVFLTCSFLLSKDKKQVRCNSSRFSWAVTSVEEVQAEQKAEAIKAKAIKEATVIREQFSFKEHMMLSFYPRIIEQQVWVYTEKAVAYCVEHRIEVFKKLSRAIKELKKEYDSEVAKDLKLEFRQKIARQAELWKKACVLEFTQMQYTVHNTLLKFYKEVPDFIITAYLARKLINLRRQHDAEMNAVLAKKLGFESPTIEMPAISKLYILLEGFMPDAEEIRKVDKDLSIQIGLKVLKNKLSLIEWGD